VGLGVDGMISWVLALGWDGVLKVGVLDLSLILKSINNKKEVSGWLREKGINGHVRRR
jgi:hypothetical protein